MNRPEQPEDPFADARAAAGAIVDPATRGSRLVAIAEARIQAGLDIGDTIDEALAAANDVADAAARAALLCDIADAEVKLRTHSGTLCVVADTISTVADPGDRGRLLTRLAVARAGSGLSPTEAFADATAAANASDDPMDRAYTLAEIAEAQHRVGVGTSETFAYALAAAREIADPYWRVLELVDVAAGQNDTGADSDETLVEALASSAAIDAFRRGVALGRISRAHVEAGRPSRALAVAAAIEDSFDRIDAFTDIVRVQADFGLNVGDLVTRTLEDAVAAALAALDVVEEPDERDHALNRIAHAYLALGRHDEASQIFRALTDDWNRGYGLVDVAHAQAKAGSFADALATASAVEDDYDYRVTALCDIAMVQAEAGLDASETLSEAFGYAQGVADVGARAACLERIAQAELETTVDATATLAAWTTAALALDDERLQADMCLEVAITKARATQIPARTPPDRLPE